jgi:leucyl-tRNA synthetase
MELLNVLYEAQKQGAAGTDAWSEALELYLLMMAPAAPHITEELWTEILEKPYSIHNQPWPEADREIMKKEEITLIVQVNGKLRDRIVVPVDITKEEAEKTALASGGAAPYLEGKQVKKVIVVPGRLVNIVV